MGSGSLNATIIHVPADQPTIQAGIDEAMGGDTVLVADGTYTGPGNRDIDFGGKGIFVKSENGSDVTIIDCEGSILDRHRGFYFHRGEDTTAVVAGFTVLNGWEFQGGGILCEKNSSPTIMSNAINGNFRSGIWCVDSDPTISNNTINDNAGGGIWCEDSSPPISNNTISGNSGSGISLVNSSATIINNTISDNFSFFGGGIYCSNSSPIISNNIISENWDSAGGGGISARRRHRQVAPRARRHAREPPAHRQVRHPSDRRRRARQAGARHAAARHGRDRRRARD
ncbi:MAG: right-handed parallel beta-helix repeat-containing protein, partial [candidate division Zixibacteria bacterium]|nr:right-handed parallel beta-helix repeat-containing protein [candidate division Zixibacteria bacterium]